MTGKWTIPVPCYGALFGSSLSASLACRFSRRLSLGRPRARSIAGLFPRSPSEPYLILVASYGSPVSLSLQLWPLPRFWIMFGMVLAVRISRTNTSFPWETCLTSPWVFFYSSYPSVDGSPVLRLLLRLRHLRARAP